MSFSQFTKSTGIELAPERSIALLDDSAKHRRQQRSIALAFAGGMIAFGILTAFWAAAALFLPAIFFIVFAKRVAEIVRELARIEEMKRRIASGEKASLQGDMLWLGQGHQTTMLEIDSDVVRKYLELPAATIR